MVQRCSPGFLGRRSSGKTMPGTDQVDGPTPSTHRPTKGSVQKVLCHLNPRNTGVFLEKNRGWISSKDISGYVLQVSVAIDATPGARSSSVLRQLPIELSKSLDESARASPDSMASPDLSKSTPTLCGRLPLQRAHAVTTDEQTPVSRATFHEKAAL